MFRGWKSFHSGKENHGSKPQHTFSPLLTRYSGFWRSRTGTPNTSSHQISPEFHYVVPNWTIYGNAAWIITISRLDEQGKTLPSGVTSLRFSLPPPITGELRLSTFAELLPRCRGATNFPATPIHSQEQQNKSVFVFSGLLRMQL